MATRPSAAGSANGGAGAAAPCTLWIRPCGRRRTALAATRRIACGGGWPALKLDAADLLGVSGHTGRLAVGFEADLIVVEGNPLDDPRALQDALVVISNGQVAVNRLPFGRP